MRCALTALSLLLCACSSPSPLEPGPDAPPADAGPDALSDDAGPDAPAADADRDAAGADVGCALALGGVEANLEGLLFTSESDYPLVLEVFAGEGETAPTPDLVARLAGAPAAAFTETRDVATFWARLVVDPTVSPLAPETRPAMLQAAVEAALTDLAFVRVIDPANPVEVRVFLVGRACGSLVWLASTSIET